MWYVTMLQNMVMILKKLIFQKNNLITLTGKYLPEI